MLLKMFTRELFDKIHKMESGFTETVNVKMQHLFGKLPLLCPHLELRVSEEECATQGQGRCCCA